MIRRRFLQLLAGTVIGTAAALNIPGRVLAKTAIGRRSACEVIRRCYLDHLAQYGVEPQLLVAEKDLYDAFGDELASNLRFIERLSPREAYDAFLPEHRLFKHSRVVSSPRPGWAITAW